MSLFDLNRTGLLTKEITFLLSNLNKNHDWKTAELKLYSSGLTPSKSRTYELVFQIKKRFNNQNQKNPNLDELIALAKSNLSFLTKAEVYYVYLYYSDENISNLVNFIAEIYDNNPKNPLIKRRDIKTLILKYLRGLKYKIHEKTLRNWIGKFLSIMKEINIFKPLERHEYFINFGNITYEAWTFFALNAFFNNYSLLESPFIKPFHILPDHIINLINYGKKRNWVTYQFNNEMGITNKIEIETQFKNIEQWLGNLK